MDTRKEPGSLLRLVREILDFSNASSQRRSLLDARRDLRRLADLDYREQLRKRFSQVEIRALKREMRRFLPELNRRVFRETNLRRLAETAARFGADLRVDEFEGDEGCALRGFYLNDATLLKRPLIVLNGSNEPVSVAASFWHEMGHHLTEAIFGNAPDGGSLVLSTSYEEHLSHPKEITADLVMVLGGYPKPIAQQLFGCKSRGGDSIDAGELVAKARRHLRTIAEFEFDPDASAVENLHYLAGMIHLAKLRAALLHEYGI
jgi:hypothetical protein